MNLQIFIPLLFICSCGLLQQDRQDFADRRYTYKDDFDDEQPGELPGYWVEKLGQHSWVVDMDRKNRFLTQGSIQEKASCIYLHLFDRNPVFSGKFRIKDILESGHMAFLVRYNAEGSWIRIEYDPSTNSFILLEQEDNSRKPRLLDRTSHGLDEGWHTFGMVLDSMHITFFLDGREVLSSDNLRHCTFGRIGFETSRCLLQIDEITYAGNHGRPNDGIVEGEIRVRLDSVQLNSGGRPFWGLHLGILPRENRELVGIVGFRDYDSRDTEDGLSPFAVIQSKDDGKTWKGLEGSERKWLKSTDGSFVRGIWPNLAETEDGYILMGMEGAFGQNSSYYSGDRGETWQKRGSLLVNDTLAKVFAGHPWQLDRMTMPGKLGNYSGVLFYPTTRVLWKSSDFGHNWLPVCVFHPDNRTWNPRSQEHQIIDLGKGKLAVYSRDDGARESKSESGTIVKRFSSDGGYTWSGYEINNTPFVSSKCAFSVKQDPYLENTCWMFWTYNDKQDEPDVNNQPRTRLGLAVSYDNTESWQYVMDVDDWGFPGYDTTTFELNRQAEGLEKIGQRQRYLQRDNRYANLALWVTPDYLYLTVRRRFWHGINKFDDFCIFYTRVEKSKIRTYPEFPGTRY